MAKDFQNLAKVTASYGKSGHTGHQTSRYSLGSPSQIQSRFNWSAHWRVCPDALGTQKWFWVWLHILRWSIDKRFGEFVND